MLFNTRLTHLGSETPKYLRIFNYLYDYWVSYVICIFEGFILFQSFIYDIKYKLTSIAKFTTLIITLSLSFIYFIQINIITSYTSSLFYYSYGAVCCNQSLEISAFLNIIFHFDIGHNFLYLGKYFEKEIEYELIQKE